MTFVRKLALKISDAVVRFASSARKEWAEGLSREVAFIESDWSALGWALGSTRLLLDRRVAPAALIGSLADVPATARSFAESKRQEAALWPLFFGLSLVYGLKFSFDPFLFHRSYWLDRVGCSLLVLSSILAGIWFLIERRRLKALLSGAIGDHALFYKGELQRSLEFQYSSAWLAG
jgi:hypothetical protein